MTRNKPVELSIGYARENLTDTSRARAGVSLMTLSGAPRSKAPREGDRGFAGAELDQRDAAAQLLMHVTPGRRHLRREMVAGPRLMA